MERARIRHRRAAVVVLAVVAALVSWTGAAQAAGVVWQSDFTNAAFGNFKSTPWNYVNAPAPTIVPSSVNAPPAKAAEFTVPGGGTRSEIEPNVPDFTEGADYYFGDTFTLPATFPVTEQSWQVISQWKNADTGSPPVELKIGEGKVILDGGYGYPGAPAGSKYWKQPLGNAITGQPMKVVLHIHFSANPSLGSIDAWVNGAQVLTAYRPISGTLYPTAKKTKASATQAKKQQQAQAATPQPKGTPKEPAASTDTAVTTSTTSAQIDYWKMGMYRDSAISSTATYDVESARMGPTLADATG